MSRKKRIDCDMSDLTASKSELLTDGLSGRKAKKDFIILHNDFRADIKAGDDLSDIPDLYFQNLKTEKVI